MPGFIWSGIRIDRTKQIHKKGRCEKPVPKINMKPFTKKIVLENGREFYGYGFGADREVINEIVFNTSMVGYQEIMSDPSYTDQMVVMTYPLIGNYGMADEDYETKDSDHRRHDRARVQRLAEQLPLYEDPERGLRGA